MKRIIALILSIAVLTSFAVIPGFSVSAADTVVKKYDFNTMTDAEFSTLKSSLVAGGVYNIDGVSLDSATAYGNSGKSFKMAGIDSISNRVKFTGMFGKDTFTAADKGKKYTVSVKVYAPKETTFTLGIYGATGTPKAYTPIASEKVSAKANAWTEAKIGLEVTDEIISNNTTQIGICQKDAPSAGYSDTLYFDELTVTEGSLPPATATTPETPAPTTPAPTTPTAPTAPTAPSSNGIMKRLNFDTTTALGASEIMAGANYKIEKVTISSQYDHTSGKGKSVCFGGRSATNDRLKFMDLFTKEGLDTTFNVSAWLLSPNMDASIKVGIYSTAGTDFAINPLKSINVDLKKGEWTEVLIEYEHTNEIISQLGFESNTVGVTEIYIDDIGIIPEGMEVAEPEVSAFPNVPEEYLPIAKKFGDLKLINDFLVNYNGDAEMKRGEFANLLAEFLPSVVSDSADTKYSDVNSSTKYSGKIKALTDLNILKGNEKGEFKPDDVVLAEESIAALISFLGYEVYANGLGGYPTGYLNTAAKIGLTDGVSITTGKGITNEQLLLIINNFIDIDVLKETQFGTVTKYKTEEGITILANNFDIYSNEGFVLGTPKTMISSSNSMPIGQVNIDGETYLTEELNFDNYLGYNVEYYYKKIRNQTPTLVSVTPVDGFNKTIKVATDDISEIENSRITYYDENGREKSIRFTSSQNMIYNGKYKTFDNELLNIDEGYLLFLDADVDGIYETVFVNDVYYFVVDSVDATNEIIYSKYDRYDDINYDSTDDVNTFELVGKNGKEVDPSTLKEWDVLTISKSDSKGDGSTIHAIMARQTVKGTVESIKREDNSMDSIKIGEKYYDLSETIKNMFVSQDGNEPDLSEFVITQDVILSLTDIGTIATYQTNSARSGKLGYLFTCELPDTANPRMELTILTEDNKWETYSLADKVRINGSLKSNTYREVLESGAFYNADINETSRQILMYTLDSDNHINKLWYDFSTTASDPIENQFYKNIDNKKAYYTGGSSKNIFTTASNVNQQPAFKVTDNFVGFVIPQNSAYIDDESYYSVHKASGLNTDETGNINFTGYSLSGEKTLVDVGIRKRDVSLTSYTSTFMLINSVSSALDDDGEEVTVLTGLAAGKEKSITIYDERADKSKYELSAGDIITYTNDASGKITFTGSSYGSNCISMVIDYVPSSDKKFGSFNNTVSGVIVERGKTIKTMAIPYKLKSGDVTLAPISSNSQVKGDGVEVNPDPTNLQVYKPSAFANVYVFDTTTNTFRSGKANDVITYENDTINYTPVWMYAYYNTMRAFVIYK